MLPKNTIHTISRTVLAFFMVMSSLSLHAQTPVLSDQFIMNPFQTNPAVAGIYRYMPVRLTVRQQWFGMKAAPMTQSFTIHTNLTNRKATYNPQGFLNKGINSFGKVGIGGGVYNFTYGAISQIGIHLDYAYHIYLGKGRLALGLAPMYQQYIIDKSRFILPDGDRWDPVIHGDAKETLHFLDANIGIHYYSDRLYAGFSVIQLFNSTAMFGSLSYQSLEDPFNNPYLARTFYGYTGVVIPLGTSIELEPSVLASYNSVSRLSTQIITKVRVMHHFDAGAIWQYGKSLGFYAGTSIGDLVVRYLYEAPLGTRLNNGFSTHQILAGYNIHSSAF